MIKSDQANILKLPCNRNRKLEALMKKIGEDKRLRTFWKCANIMAIDRMGYTDHGPIHVKIIANSALKILRILIGKGVVPSIVKEVKSGISHNLLIAIKVFYPVD